jgi:hypothetical protein
MQNTTTKTNNVFLNAEDAAIVVTVNNTVVATDVQTADALVQVFLTHNVNVNRFCRRRGLCNRQLCA